MVTKSGGNTVHGSTFYYVRDDKFDSKNAFDLQKSPLSLKQFGGSAGGPIAKNRAFFFGSYEGYRLESGINFIEGVPSAAAFQRAVPAIQPLFDAFRAPGAVVLPGASANPDFDILQLQSTAERAREFRWPRDRREARRTNWTIVRPGLSRRRPERPARRRHRPTGTHDAKPANGVSSSRAS